MTLTDILARKARAALLIGAFCAAQFPAFTAEAASNMGTLRVSPLRIMCIKAPCPPWDAMAISRGSEAPGPHPLYLGPLPALIGKKSDTAQIAKAWRKKQCLIIRGSLKTSGKPAVLIVGRVLRAC